MIRVVFGAECSNFAAKEYITAIVKEKIEQLTIKQDQINYDKQINQIEMEHQACIQELETQNKKYQAYAEELGTKIKTMNGITPQTLHIQILSFGSMNMCKYMF